MKKILAIAGSNHSKSINQQLVDLTVSLVDGVEVKVLDIRSWAIPVYSIDMDPDQTPTEITELIALIQAHDGFILSSPEHNGSIPAFLKNIIDWLSRRAKKVFDNKPMLLMSAAPGATGGANNRKHLERILPYQGIDVVATYSLPFFHKNMQDGQLEGELLEGLKVAIQEFQTKL